MKRFILCTLLVVAFGVYSHIHAQSKKSGLGWGLSAGGAYGDNSKSDKWGMQYRGFLQSGLFSPMLIGQLGLGYTDLEADAPGAYSAETFIVDLRLLFSPFTLPNLNPYIYGGFGLSKQLNRIGSDYLPMIPLGAGIQTKISSGVLLAISGGYNLSLSDKLDGRNRSNTDLNGLTNGKNDGFFGFSIGLAFTLGSGDDAEVEARRVKAEENAWHAKELANAEARRVQDSVNAATAASNIKALTDAEARRIQDSTKAAAETARVQAVTIAEAQRIKDSTDAVARRLAEEKGRDTFIILEKGKTVVLRGVNFETNKATLTKYSEKILWKAYNAMVANPDVQVVITGHTDNVGSEKYNQALSLKRAQSVKNWLVKKGIASNRMRTVGKGENEPVASNETEQGRLENRRMEFYVEK